MKQPAARKASQFHSGLLLPITSRRVSSKPIAPVEMAKTFLSMFSSDLEAVSCTEVQTLSQYLTCSSLLTEISFRDCSMALCRFLLLPMVYSASVSCCHSFGIECVSAKWRYKGEPSEHSGCAVRVSRTGKFPSTNPSKRYKKYQSLS